jgi:pimeloyl-ACP methyl ester carboxylesterase
VIAALHMLCGGTDRPMMAKEHGVSTVERWDGFDSRGVEIRYVARGQGEPIVLLHGFIFSARSNWLDGGVFDALGRDHRVIAFDLRGHGTSGKPHDIGQYGIEMTNDVFRLMDHLKIQRAHIVGYSLGGIIALKLIDVAPQRVLSLVLGGAGWVRAGDPQWAGLANMLDQIAPGETLSSHFWPDQNQRPPQQVVQIVDDNDPVALAALSRGMSDVAVSERALRANRVPILAVFGTKDPHQAEGQAMQGVASNFSLQIIPGLTHETLAGSEAFRHAIRAFVSNSHSR